MTIQWIIQKNLINPIELEKIKLACENNSIKYELVEVVPFSNILSEFSKNEDNNIYYGSTTFIQNINKTHSPGIFLDDNFNMKTFNFYWKEFMLN